MRASAPYARDLLQALRRAEAAHGQHEARTGQRDANWPAAGKQLVRHRAEGVAVGRWSVCGLADACSGDMWAGLPSATPAIVRVLRPVASLTAFATPKSRSATFSGE